MKMYAFHKGLRLDRPEWELETGELPHLVNWVYGDQDQGLLQKRRGLSRVVSTGVDTKPILGVYRASVKGSNPHTLVAAGGKVYRVQDGSSPSWGAAVLSDLWSTARVRFDTWKEYVWIVNGVDELHAWNGTAATEITGAPAGCRFVQHYADRLFIGGSAQFPDTLFYSQLLYPADSGTIADADQWQDPETEIQLLIDIAPGDNQRLTGLKRTQDKLTIFKSNSTYYLVGYDPEEWVLRRISDSIGCIAPDSVVEMDGRTIWLSHRGVYMDDGVHFYRIGAAIQPFVSTLTADQQEAAVAVISGWNYILIFPDTPNDGCVAFSYHVRNEAWVRWDLGVSIGTICPKNLPTDKGGWIAGAADNTGLIFHGETGGQDDGQDIVASLRLPIVGQTTPEAVLDLRRVALDATADESDTMTVAWTVDDKPPVERTFEGSGATIFSTPAGTLGRLFSVGVTVDGSGTDSLIRGIAAEVRVKRRRW